MPDASLPWAVPARACDAHFHTVEVSEGAVLAPPRAGEDHSVAAVLGWQGAHGLGRGVLVQTRRQSMERFAAMLGESGGRWRGLMWPGGDVDRVLLQRMHQAGVRGCRFSLVGFMKGSTRATETTIRRMAERVWPMGWHLDFHVEGQDLLDHEALFRRLDGPYVIDHMAHMRVAPGLGQPAFGLLLDLLQQEHVWLKLSGLDRWSLRGAPDYQDAIPFGRAAVKAAPRRTIWGSDSPFVMYKDPHQPDPGLAPPRVADLLRLLAAYCESEPVWRDVLVNNPARLFGFAGPQDAGPGATSNHS